MLCARLAARSLIPVESFSDALEVVAAKIRDEMPAVVAACRSEGRDGAKQRYELFVDSLVELF
jgi:hypothetical protein